MATEIVLTRSAILGLKILVCPWKMGFSLGGKLVAQTSETDQGSWWSPSQVIQDLVTLEDRKCRCSSRQSYCLVLQFLHNVVLQTHPSERTVATVN